MRQPGLALGRSGVAPAWFVPSPNQFVGKSTGARNHGQRPLSTRGLEHFVSRIASHSGQDDGDRVIAGDGSAMLNRSGVPHQSILHCRLARNACG